ncbi:MAG: M16 family metallopeptidase [Rhodospirillales bacterium]
MKHLKWKMIWLVLPLALIASLFASQVQAKKVQRVISPQGIEAWLVEDHSNPILSVRFAFRGGAALDPAGKEGLANMVSGLLDEGAGDLDSQAFQRKLEDLSVRLRFSAGRDSFFGRLKTLSKRRDKAFDLLRVALTSPRFDDEPVERIRSQIIAGLKQELEDPDTIASRALMRRLFPSHPYGRVVRGSIKSVQSLTQNDLRAFVKQRLARSNLIIGVVGDIRADELGKLIDKAFAGLPKAASTAAVKDVVPFTDGKVTVIKKQFPQSSIAFAQRGLMRNDPDFYTLYVLNYILGRGGFTSRLYLEVREKRGLAYSVSTGLYPLDHTALIWGSSGTANKRAAETLKVVRAEWARLAQKGVTPKELQDAKTYLTGSFPLRFTSSGRIASILLSMQFNNLGLDYLDKRNGLIEKVTLKEVNALARRLLDPKKLSIVVVGDPKGVKNGL